MRHAARTLADAAKSFLYASFAFSTAALFGAKAGGSHTTTSHVSLHRRMHGRPPRASHQEGQGAELPPSGVLKSAQGPSPAAGSTAWASPVCQMPPPPPHTHTRPPVLSSMPRPTQRSTQR